MAEALRRLGHVVRYLINDHELSTKLIVKRDFEVQVVDLLDPSGWETAWLAAHTDVRVWVNDRLNTEARHSLSIKAAGIALVTFDDRGDGAACADLHVAPLAFDDGHQLQGKKVLYGIDYLTLDAELARWQRERVSGDRWLISMGGADTWGATLLAMQALLVRGQTATVVLGPAFLFFEQVDELLSLAPAGQFTVRREGVPSLYQEMFHHDVAITAGGMTPFQANATGLPCVVVATETFEVPVARQLEKMGGSLFAGFRKNIDWSILDHPHSWSEMSRKAMRSLDLLGCQRVCSALCNLAKDVP